MARKKQTPTERRGRFCIHLFYIGLSHLGIRLLKTEPLASSALNSYSIKGEGLGCQGFCSGGGGFLQWVMVGVGSASLAGRGVKGRGGFTVTLFYCLAGGLYLERLPLFPAEPPHCQTASSHRGRTAVLLRYCTATLVQRYTTTPLY